MSGNRKRKSQSALRVGSSYFLSASTDDWAFVAKDEAAFEAMVRASVRGDRETFTQLGRSKRVFAVFEPARIEILDADLTKAKIKILEGQQAGKTGWVPVEFIKGSP